MRTVELIRVPGKDVDRAAAEGIAAVHNAANAVDAPHLAPVSGQHEQRRLVHGWELIPIDEVILAYDGEELVGFGEVDLPRWDNTHVGFVSVQTRPERRGEGIGDEVLAAARTTIDDAGKTLLMSGAWVDTHRAAFWARHGLEVAMRQAQRRLLTADLDWPHLDALYEQAAAASSDYEIVEVPSPTPAGELDE